MPIASSASSSTKILPLACSFQRSFQDSVMFVTLSLRYAIPVLYIVNGTE